MNSVVFENYITERRVEGDLLERLQTLSLLEQQALNQFVAALSPSANTLREVIALVDGIAAREGVSFTDILSNPELAEIYAEQDWSRKEKQRRVRLVLEHRRYPVLTKIQNELQSCVSQIRSELGIVIELPKDLEGDTLSLSISANSPEKFAVLGEKLKQASSHAALKRIFQLLHGELGAEDAKS